MKKLVSVLLALVMACACIGCTAGTVETAPAVIETRQETVPLASVEAQETVIEIITETEEMTVEEPVTEAETEEEIEDEGWDKLDALGKIETENGILTATITIPADLAGDVTQEDLDAKAGVSYIYGKKNDDGSVTYKMTKAQHKAMLDTLTKSFEESFAGYVEGDDYAFTKIEHNKDFTQFEVTCSVSKLGLAESFSALAFYMTGGMYGVFSGEKPEKVIVNFYGPDGQLISTADSSKAGK